MRLLAVFLVTGLVLAPGRAVAGGCPDCPPPALGDSEQRPTVKAAIAVTKKLLKALRSKDQAKVTATLAIPFLYDLSGRALDGMGCYDGPSYVDEAEAMPGRPACLIKVLAKTAKKLEGQASKKNVFASLAALENKKGALRSRSRGEIETLINHRFVYLEKGALTVVVAVRSDGGVAVIDAVIVDPPKHWVAPPEVAEQPASTALDAPKIKAGVGAVLDAVLDCGKQATGVTGVVKLKVKVSPNGAVTEVTVMQTPDAALGECAAKAMKRAKFDPTEQGGSFSYPFSF